MTERLNRVSARRLLLLAGLSACAVSGVTASSADAAFTLAKCGGDDVGGRGASFARDAHIAWRSPFRNVYCPGDPDISYAADGSGAGRQTVGQRGSENPTGSRTYRSERFAGTDEAPNPTQQTQINNGLDATGDEAQVHVIPVAVGAVAVVVNWPNNCDRTALDNAAETDPTATNFTNRVRFTKAQFEEIMWGDSSHDKWTEIFPELAGDADCDVPIKRVVRQDASGTTFALKDYLQKIKSDRPNQWTSTAYTAPNTNWPNTAGAADPGTNPVITGGGSGNGPLVNAVQANDGSIGYSDLSTARTAGLGITPTNNIANRDDDVFWTQVQNGSGTFTEPTSDANGFRTDGTKGANCNTTTFTDVPANTFGNWFPTSGTNSPAGYGICTLTYVLAFDDNAVAYGNTAAEQAKARTVKDYLDFVVSNGGQGILPGSDYAALPDDIKAKAQAGVASIGWNKAGVGQNPGNQNPPPDDGGNNGNNNPPRTNNPSTPPPVVRPSNVFSIPSASVARSSKRAITLNLRVPGAGELRGVATARTKKVGKRKARNLRVGAATLRPTGAGTFKLVIRPSRATLAAVQRQKKLKVKIAVTFTPAGGEANTVDRTVTLKAAKKKKRR